MIVRSLLLALGGGLLCAADAPPLPLPLEPYVKDGRFEPGDYGWMRGRFDDSGPAQKAEFQSVRDWADRCMADAKRETLDALAAEGFPGARLEDIAVGPLLCRQVSAHPEHPALTSYAVLQHELTVARPVAESFVMAVNLARETGSMGLNGDFARTVALRVQLDQMLARALGWGGGAASEEAPTLPPVARAIVQARINTAYQAQVEGAAEWLRRAVAQDGWPTESRYGAVAPLQAWLLVQHADHDPLFQLRMLRLMEPLVAQGEVSKSNYAYLYDRVMLKLAGRQRYGTQFHCVGGERSPQPLEDAAAADRLRRDFGMETVAENLASMERSFGPCPRLDAPSGDGPRAKPPGS